MAEELLTEQQTHAIYLLVYKNMKQKEVAAELGVSEITVSRWKKVDIFAKKFKEELENKFNALAAKSVSKLEELMDCDSKPTALGAAKYILDYTGFKPVEKQEVKHEGVEIKIDYGEKEETPQE